MPDSPLLEDVLAIVLDTWTLVTAGGIFILFRALANWPWLAGRSWYKRVLPILPEMVGVAASLGGGIPATADKPIVIRIAAGLWCAYVAQKFRKFLGQSLLGDDPVIAAKVAKENGDDS